MIWQLLGVLLMGLCAGGVAAFLRTISRNKLPKWIIPAFAGCGMFGFMVYYDYTWYDFKADLLRTQGGLAESGHIIHEDRKSSFFRPWSYILPPVSGFIVIDGTSKQILHEGQLLTEYYSYHLNKNPLETLTTYHHVLNCTTLERATINNDIPDKAGKFKFHRIDRSDPAYQILCI